MKAKLKGEKVRESVFKFDKKKKKKNHQKSWNVFNTLSVILCLGNFPKEIIYSKDMHKDVVMRTVQPKLGKCLDPL